MGRERRKEEGGGSVRGVHIWNLTALLSDVVSGWR
jgi:hypothetical protein